MARYSGPRLKIVRRLGTALPGLIRTDPDLRRPYPPGQHGPTRRKKLSDYALRLMEKQKLRYHYGLSEKQLRRYMAEAVRTKGNTGTNLLASLERRLDNVVFRSGLAPTIPSARQMTNHGHILVNGKRVNIASYQLKHNDVVTLRDVSKWKDKIEERLKDPNNLAYPQYLEVDVDARKASIKALPDAEDCPVDIDPQLIVEYYSGR
jgi:small subunit ribosomal protein S4